MIDSTTRPSSPIDDYVIIEKERQSSCGVVRTTEVPGLNVVMIEDGDDPQAEIRGSIQCKPPIS